MKIGKQYKILSFLLLVLLIYLFWGPLFLWNPIKIGYTKISSQQATVFINDITEKDSAVYKIKSIVKEIEELHGLKYNDDFTIIILDKNSNMRRY